MKLIKQDLLTLLIGLFLFPACKSSNTIGIEPEDGYSIKGDLAVTEVGLTTVPEEATNTVGLTKYPLGWVSADPVFGSSESSLSFSVALAANNYSFGDDPLVDSAVLVLPYSLPVDSSVSSHFYGDTATTVYAFDVRQLKNDLSLETTFPSNKDWPAKDEVVGSFKAKLRPNTRPKIVDIVAGAADTVRQVPTPQIRIRLNPTFIQNNIVNLDSATYMTRNSRFTSSFKGLKVSVNKENMSGPGGFAFLNFTSTDQLAQACVAIYYKKLQSNSLINRDTAVVYFPISATSGPIAAKVSHDYTGTDVENQLNVPNPATPYQRTYLQGMGGLRNRISFPKLDDFVTTATGGNKKVRVVINRAELVVNVEGGTDVAPWTPAERLSLYRLDIAGQRANLVDNAAPASGTSNPYYEGAFGGNYSKSRKRYIFIVTGYIQQLVDGTTKDYGTYLAPAPYAAFSLTPAINTAERSVIVTGSAASGNTATKLNIYYTLAAQK